MQDLSTDEYNGKSYSFQLNGLGPTISFEPGGRGRWDSSTYGYRLKIIGSTISGAEVRVFGWADFTYSQDGEKVIMGNWVWHDLDSAFYVNGRRDSDFDFASDESTVNNYACSSATLELLDSTGSARYQRAS
ncbi:hypothetical protein ACFC58_25630 [Kitasatospora purpeofusca]|uniref:hypothetical protein n=1 Tax=Kitasatospora purpeofusca TaxID=67352 RepID=UPI0035D928AF